MNRIFITGDTHGRIHKLVDFHDNMRDELDKSDVMIIAGDWGLIWSVFLNDTNECTYKQKLNEQGITYFVVFGNHENYDRIEELPTKEMFGNDVMYEPEYENIVYAKNGCFYSINGKNIWTHGGGFSIDKVFRSPHYSWWEQEVPTKEELDISYAAFENEIGCGNKKLDLIVTHTCPLDLQPYDKFLACVDQNDVNKDLETMLQKVWDCYIKNHNENPKWCCGHFHLDEQRDIRFLYRDIIEITN